MVFTEPLTFFLSIYAQRSLRIQRFSGQYFPAFGLNTDRYSVSLRIQFKCGKTRTRKPPNIDTFHAVTILLCCYQ